MIRKLLKTNSVFLRNLLLTTVLGGIIGILNYLFNIFIARYTDQSIFSDFSSALGIIYIVQIPAMGIQALVTKAIARNKEKNLNRFKWYSFFLFSFIGIIFSIVFFLSKGIVSDIASIPPSIIFYLALTLLFSFVSPVGKGLLLGLEKIVSVNLILLLETVLKFGMGYFAIKQVDPLPLLILANAIPAILTTLVILPSVKFNDSGEGIVKVNFKELILITLSFLFLTVPFTVDLILVNPEFRAEYAGISLLGKLIYFASITTASVVFARLANENDSGKQVKSLLLALGLSFGIGIFLSVIYFLSGDVVVSLSLGDQYSSISSYLGIYGLCMTGFASVYMIATYFISREYYMYLVILFCVMVVQVSLFVFRNGSLDVVIFNQVIVYALLTVSTLLYLLYKLRGLKNG